jgi:hypothetical protein
MQRELIETDIGELALLCTVKGRSGLKPLPGSTAGKVDRRLLLADDKKMPAANNPVRV